MVPLLLLAPRATERPRPSVGEGALAAYAVPAFVAYLGFSALTSVDLIVVKALFPDEAAGLFAGAVVLGEIVLYLPLAVGLVLFPMVSERAASGDHGRTLLVKALITVGLSGVVVVGYARFPDLVVRLVLGSKFAGSAPLAPVMGVAMGLLGIVNVFMQYLVAARRFAYRASLVAFAALEVVLILRFHSSLEEVILAITAATGLAALVGAVVAFRPVRAGGAIP